ncbi:MAG TPA: HNH endonuclease [Polyangiaceae bacterium]|nr:HNH endonuclease [Polyangiaceae bacterium]
MRPTLLLNAWMLPQRIISWQEAITLWFLGKVDVLEAYDLVVSSPSTSVPMPAVVRLRRLVPHVRRGVKFSRANVFSRDGYTCQYCASKKPRCELSFDHVVPRTFGGRTAWENIVTACRPCNLKKRNRTPEQAGMRLLRKPMRPQSLPIEPMSFGGREIPIEWRDYCMTAPTVAA